MRHTGRVDQEAIVPGQLTIRPVDARVVAVGVGNPRRQVIHDDALRHPAQERQRRDMAVQPGGTLLGGRRIEELVAAMAQR